jgi:hypothetical protein
MKNFFSTIILLIFFILILFILVLSTIGIETNKFNSIISSKINQTNNDINLDLNTIKFKFDIKKISLFLETNNTQIDFRKTQIPVKNIKVFIDFLSLIKSESKIKKINLVLHQLDSEQLKKLSLIFKPSNFTSFIKNKIKQGKLNIELEVYLDNNNLLDNFIARGSVTNLKAEIISDIHVEKTNFTFFADKSDILLKNINSRSGPFNLTDGDLKLTLSPEISLETNFQTNLKYNDQSENYINIIKDLKYTKDLISLEADLNNSFIIEFDKTYKIKAYTYKSNGKILKATLDFKKPIDNFFLDKKINQLSLINSEIKTNFNSKKNIINISGKYLINKENDPLSFNLENIINKELLNLKVNIDYSKLIELEFINYKKKNGSIANISLDLEKKNDFIKIKNFNLMEGNNFISIDDLKFNKEKFSTFKKFTVKTSKGKKINNDFSINYEKKISIKGKKFDASNLPKILNRKEEKNKFSHISKEIEIDFANITVPLSENLKNFRLIGKIEKGNFTKISSKGDFGANNFLDITMKEDKKNKKKYLEIYSDLTKPLLTEYSFFKGLTGGKMLFSSAIDGESAKSKLKIENFKVINAPGMIKLLSLADLGGLADLAEGEGLSFDILEINMEKNKDFLKLNEIVALGPSISVIMEGYQNPTVTSLRGTLVPAKTLNKMISKIPVLGDIIIPKDVGEGLFGISFKMKGPPGKIKTTINPIRTLTPRFIQKIIDKRKNTK